MANTIKAEEIERIKDALWLMEFKDHWTPEDWAERDRLNARLAQLQD